MSRSITTKTRSKVFSKQAIIVVAAVVIALGGFAGLVASGIVPLSTSPSLKVSLAPSLVTPTKVLAGAQNQIFAAIVLDGKTLTKDVLVKEFNFKVTTRGGSKPSEVMNFRIFDGNNQLITTNNPDSEVEKATTNGQSSMVKFTLSTTTPLIITKGTSKTLLVKANIAISAIDGFYRVGIGGTGVTPLNTVYVVGGQVPVSYTLSSGTEIAFLPSGSLTISLDAASPSTARLVAGSKEVELARIKLTATGEDLRITYLSICVDDGGINPNIQSNFSSISQLRLFYKSAMSTQEIKILDIPVVSPCTAVGLGANSFIVPKGSAGGTLTVKGDTAGIGEDQPGTSGADIKVGIKNASGIIAVGVSTAKVIPLNSINYVSGMGNPVIVYKGYPKVTANSVTNRYGPGVLLYDLNITNPTNNPIAIDRLSFTTKDPTGKFIVLKGFLYAKLDSWLDFKEIAPQADGVVKFDGKTYFTFNFWNQDKTPESQALLINPGQVARFKFSASNGTIGRIGGVPGYLEVSLLGDKEFKGGFMVENESQSNFIWSDLYMPLSSVKDFGIPEWNNGFGVDGLLPISLPVKILE